MQAIQTFISNHIAALCMWAPFTLLLITFILGFIRWYKTEVIDYVDREQQEANKHFIDEMLEQ